MPLSFGPWAPVCGGWLRLKDHAPTDAAPARALKVELQADRFRHDVLYVPEHYLNAVYGPDQDVADAWVVASAAVARTTRVQVITAVQPRFRLPGVGAKMGATAVDSVFLKFESTADEAEIFAREVIALYRAARRTDAFAPL